jgi:hypothetical protein
MPRLNAEKVLLQAHERISRARNALAKVDYLCSGTLLKRMMKCGKASCGCQTDPAARHGPYYEWGHMKDGKLVHRYVSLEQAQVLHQAIANYRNVQKLLRTWETETERVLDAQYPRNR